MGVVDHVCAAVLGQIVHLDEGRTERLALDLLGRFEDEPGRKARISKNLSGLIAILWVKYGRQASREVLEGWIVGAATHESELSKVIGTMRSAFVSGLTGSVEPGDTGIRQRSQAIAHDIVAAANSGLGSHLQIEVPSAEQIEIGRSFARLLDAVCMQLYFAAKTIRKGDTSDGVPDDCELAIFFGEVGGTLEAIGNFATPHTVYRLLEFFELLLPVNPARAFDLTMHAVRSGGRQSGYHYEPMGADRLVTLVGLFLADHNELFEDDDRRSALIDCLETFMDAGWPAAQRLLYRLPELMQ